MKKILIIVIVLAAVSGGWYYFKNGKKTGEVSYVRVKAFAKDISEFVETTGEVIPLNRVEIQPPSSGRIEQIVVDEGDKIKAGEIMALMSSTDRVAILDAARAMGDDQYRTWKDSYKPIKIISPLDGTIILKDVVEGQTVGQATVLFAISDKLILSANVDESDVGKVREGQAASIVLDAYPDNPVKGKVFQILDEGKNQSNVITYKVKIRPARVPPFFKSQMTANIKIEVARKRNALLIPSAAVAIDPLGGTAVITEITDKKPVYQTIETGLDQGDMVEVTKGLKEGDTVMFAGENYMPQQASDSGSNPLMPKRPKMPRGARRAMH
ncbi:MAG: efflux RND transporter periplasmic adaptor subunit [Elusimicrobia bacterium]|nr:efflux RND transporter periplasmic adaptor subunit [Elusimicrobiota bacterium]